MTSQVVIYESVDLVGFWFESKAYEGIGEKNSKSTGSFIKYNLCGKGL